MSSYEHADLGEDYDFEDAAGIWEDEDVDDDGYYGPDAELDEDMDLDYEAEIIADGENISDSELADLRTDVETNRVLEEMVIEADARNGAQDSILPSSTVEHIVRTLIQSRVAPVRRSATALLQEEEDDDDDDDDGSAYFFNRWGPPKSAAKFFDPVAHPMKAGMDLLRSGEFGSVDLSIRGVKCPLPKLVRRRELGVERNGRERLGRTCIPNTNGTVVANYDANVYSGQFSADSTFFYTCSQDFMLRIYDTTAPPVPRGGRQPQSYSRRWASNDNYDLQTTMKVVKSMHGNPGNWTITDVDLSPDNERMIYSSITSTIYMTKTRDATDEEQVPLYFHDRAGGRRSMWDDDGDFAIWSCRFSADGNEVVAGAGNRQDGFLFVYDLQAQKRVLKIQAHEDDINSCCWADTASGNVLVSGSDDTFVKVWDRRSLSGGKPSGVLVGHTEGITNVAPKGDGRYIISNGKDQALRLWDLRKMRSSQEFDSMPRKHYGIPHWDYRSGAYQRPRFLAHPDDCSVMTYRGHTVLRTLIRCHFSPAVTTGGSYIYSGSADGKIHIWSLDGRIVQILDRAHVLPLGCDASGAQPAPESRPIFGGAIVRDVSWHSSEPVLMSSAWANQRAKSSVARHEWKGLGRNGMSLEDVVERSHVEGAERMPGAFQPARNED